MLPIFKQLENNQIGQSEVFHGFDGELKVSKQQDVNAVAHTFVSAGEHAGLPENTDFNADTQLGLGIYNVTQDRGQRVSSYNAFLEPVQAQRDNLTIITSTGVFSLKFDDALDTPNITGVVIEKAGETSELFCNREVIPSTP